MGSGSSFEMLLSDPAQLFALVENSIELNSCAFDCATRVCHEKYAWRPWRFSVCHHAELEDKSGCRQECFLPVPGHFETPGVQSWRPYGPRHAYPENVVDYSVIPVADQM